MRSMHTVLLYAVPLFLVFSSSFWLEYFADTEAGNIISEIVENTNELIVPAIIALFMQRI